MPSYFSITTRTWLKVGLLYPFPLVFLYIWLVEGPRHGSVVAMLMTAVFMLPYALLALVVYGRHKGKERQALARLFWCLPLYSTAVYCLTVIIIIIGPISLLSGDAFPLTFTNAWHGIAAAGEMLQIALPVAALVSFSFSAAYWLATILMEKAGLLRIIAPESQSNAE